jgi:hypothetical protein
LPWNWTFRFFLALLVAICHPRCLIVEWCRSLSAFWGFKLWWWHFDIFGLVRTKMFSKWPGLAYRLLASSRLSSLG